MDRHTLSQHLAGATEKVVESITSASGLAHLNRVHLPSRDAIIRATDILRHLAFPGFFGRRDLNSDNIHDHVTALMAELTDVMYHEVRACLRYRKNLAGELSAGSDCDVCDREAARIVAAFLDAIPAVRELIASDVQAAYEADPAADNTDETILSYPGILAITIQRFAHQLYTLGVPMMPRIMTEHGHSLTGIDMHPGAKIGRRFFIDHGTGVVIGETVVIGNNVKIYQGVTLGGLAPDRLVDHFRGGVKRHPTIEDDVTIYAGATILGGETTVGRGSIIGGNVFLTQSVPPDNLVSMEAPNLKYRQRRGSRGKSQPVELIDFQI